MIRFKRAHVPPIGLDIGNHSVKMLQLEQVNGELAVVAAAKAPLPIKARGTPELRIAAAVELIRQLLRRNPFRGKSVVTALPPELLQVRNLRLPMMPVADLPRAIAFEAQHVLPFDSSDAHVAHLLAGDARQGSELRQEVILLAARNADVNQFLQAITGAGVNVRSLDLEPCALYRTVDRFIRRREDELDLHVLVDIGLERSQVLIGRGKQIRFLKSINIAGRHLQEAVSRRLGVSVEESQSLRRRLADSAPTTGDPGRRDAVRQAAYDAARGVIEQLGHEISLCLRYYSVTFRGQGPTHIRLLGGESADPQLRASLQALLPIPIELARPLHSVNTARMIPAESGGAMSDWAVAFGLALKTLEGPFGALDGRPRVAGIPKMATAI